MSIHADDEFSLRIALESELDDVLPSDGLADLVIARHRKVRRRRVAGAVSLVVVCAGIGVPLGLSVPGGKAPLAGLSDSGVNLPWPQDSVNAAAFDAAACGLVIMIWPDPVVLWVPGGNESGDTARVPA